MRAGLVTLGLLAGCGFRSDPGIIVDALPDALPDAQPDALPDAQPDAPEVDACVRFSQQLDTCLVATGGPITLSGELVYDTDSGLLSDSNSATVPVTTIVRATLGGEISAITASAVTLAPATHLRATGSRGFAIVSTGAIALSAGAVIDVSDGGAGARLACPEGAVKGEDNSGGGAGGGGGGFGAAGGKGGNGNADGLGPDSAGGRGGGVSDVPAGPLGGCPGAPGGSGGDPGGTGGRAGGAVYLVSALRIEISDGAGVGAGGGGGGGGRRSTGNGDAGGAGGGAGGMILLEAPTIRSVGILAANGGGGGEASGAGAAGRGGEIGGLGIVAALGGKDGSSTGVDGASGGFVLAPPGATPTMVQNGGGGGGGGAAGIVRVVSDDAMLGSFVSPLPR